MDFIAIEHKTTKAEHERRREARATSTALEGKVLAAQVAIRALIACHPDPEKAIETVCEHINRFAGIALAGT